MSLHQECESMPLEASSLLIQNTYSNVSFTPSESSQKKRQVKLWDDKEDELLVTLQKKYVNNWIKIAEAIPGRTPSQCIQRWRRKFQPPKVRKGWSKEEDQKLIGLVHEHGNNWKKISAFFKKTGKQIRERFINKLDPGIRRSPFTKEEDDIILNQYGLHGSKWNLISRNLPGRPQNAIKNRFYSHLKKILTTNDQIKSEEGKTEVEEPQVFESLMEEEGNTKQKPIISEKEAIHFGNFVPIYEIPKEKDREEKEKQEAKEESGQYWSDDNFLNKYIDFT